VPTGKIGDTRLAQSAETCARASYTYFSSVLFEDRAGSSECTKINAARNKRKEKILIQTERYRKMGM